MFKKKILTRYNSKFYRVTTLINCYLRSRASFCPVSFEMTPSLLLSGTAFPSVGFSRKPEASQLLKSNKSKIRQPAVQRSFPLTKSKEVQTKPIMDRNICPSQRGKGRLSQGRGCWFLHLKSEEIKRKREGSKGRIGRYLLSKRQESIFEHHRSFTFGTLLKVQTELKASRAVSTRSLREQILLVNPGPARHKKQQKPSPWCSHVKLSAAEDKSPFDLGWVGARSLQH